MTTPTSSPVPSSRAVDLLFNAEKIDEAVNGDHPTYIDRFGQARLTVKGATDTIKLVNPRGAWVTATAYASKDLVKVSGTWYFCVESHISGATFAGDAGFWRVYQGVIAVDLAAANGGTFVGFQRPETGAGLRDVYLKLLEIETVEDYYGPGITTDALAFAAMAAATNGTIRLREGKVYTVGQLNLPVYDTFRLLGGSQPSKSAALNQLINGTILRGGIAVRANNIVVDRVGVDNGSALGLSGIADGLVLNAKTGETGSSCKVTNFSVMGPTSAGTTHGLLIQGFDRAVVDNVYAGKHQFGVVVKCRNVTISNVDGDDCRTALVYPKSDVPASAGNVASGIASNFEISNVQHRADAANTTAAAVYLHASTAAFTSARVSNVSTTYGFTALRIQGGGLVGDPSIAGVLASDIRSERAQYALYCGGFTYDWKVAGLQAINPATGAAWYMDTGAYGWSINGAGVTITDAAITADNVGTCFGEGSWDAIAVRNPFRTMKVTTSWANLLTVKTGRLSGQVINSEDRNLAGINGAVAFTGVLTPKQTIMPGSVVKLSGGFNLAASANKFFCNLNTGGGRVQRFACSGVDTGSNVVNQAVQVNDFQLSVEPSLLGGFKEIYLDGITFIR